VIAAAELGFLRFSAWYPSCLAEKTSAPMTQFPEIRKMSRLPQPARMKKLPGGAGHGFLAMCSTIGCGCGIPPSRARDGQRLYFHCSPDEKCLAANNRASFCIVGKTRVIPEKFTAVYESVIAFGTMALDLPGEGHGPALRLLMQKYSPAHLQIDGVCRGKTFRRNHPMRLDIGHVTGKVKRAVPRPAA
jgi:nitroimidazol reductase NimA-like FMN-containing flavoprotein (pyridoxamine 5'-phosphate oxidase superfamily)